METLLKIKEVQRRSGLCRSSIYKMMKRGEFPQNIQLSLRCVAWLESEVDGWVQGRISSSRPNQEAA